MANLLVFIELAGDRPAEPSLEALGEGRRIASFLGATLSAVVPCASPPSYADDDLIAILGRHGADKVILVNAPELVGPTLFASYGFALAAVCERFPPALVLVAATPGGRDVAPRLAARLGAAFVPEPSIEYGPRGDLILSRPVFQGAWRRRLDADELERPVLATLTPGSYRKSAGSDEAEAVVVPLRPPPPPPFDEVNRAPDPAAALDAAPVVVTAGAGVPKECVPDLAELARALGGELAFTRDAVARGLGPADREIGLQGRQIAPRLYVCCAASGSHRHLAAVSPDAEVVAIDRDPAAPVLRVATYGLVGDVATVVPALLRALGSARPDPPGGPAPEAHPTAEASPPAREEAR